MKHCMIIDDSGFIRSVARRLLEDLQFETTEAECGTDALDKCRERMPDAILLDCHMPNMTGLECLQQLRRLPGGESPVVLFCTAENNVSQISAAIDAGATEFMIKPYDRDTLVAKLVEVGLLNSRADRATAV